MLARIFRKAFGKRFGIIAYFLSWWLLLDNIIRPLILKAIISIGEKIIVPVEKEIYLKNMVLENPLGFFLDPFVLPFVIGILFSYLIVFIVPVILVLRARPIFKN